jgi:hypothetical protein
VTPSPDSKTGLFVFNQADEYHRRRAEEAQAARQHGVAVQVYDAGTRERSRRELLWRHWKDSAPLPAVTRLAPTPYPAR